MCCSRNRSGEQNQKSNQNKNTEVPSREKTYPETKGTPWAQQHSIQLPTAHDTRQ